MNLTRHMMRHGKQLVAPRVTTPRTRDKAIKKGTPYRRLLAMGGGAVHATKGRGHPAAVLEYRTACIARATGVGLPLRGYTS
jgi:hypothetical protein